MRGAFQFGTHRRIADFTDGVTHTLLIGEKHVPLGKEGVGLWDCAFYNGDYIGCSSRGAGRDALLTTNIRDGGMKFGSRHTGVVQFCFADGRVQGLRDTTDGYILELLSTRNDGQVIPDY